MTKQKPVKNTAWNVDDLTLRQRDLIMELIEQDALTLATEEVASVKLKAIEELRKVGLIHVTHLESPAIDGVTAIPIMILVLTDEGEAWLDTLPEDALVNLPR